MRNLKTTGIRRCLRLGVAGLALVAVTGVPLVAVSGASAASTVTNPAHAKISHGRFTTPISLDNGIITVTPAPAGISTVQGLGAVSTKIWASAQLSGFSHQTLGYGYVTVKGTANGESKFNHVLAWVGFANGNTSSVCAKNSAGKFRTDGEAAVVLGDATLSQAVSYVPPGCGIAQRSGYRVPDEVVSVPWVEDGSASAHGIITFKTTIAQCGQMSGRTIARGPGALEVVLYIQRPDWSVTTCTANVLRLGVSVAKTGSKADAIRLVHGTLGPVRQVVNAA